MAQAQITPDLSLDEEISIVTPQSSQDLITGGARRGSGLFHSFEELNVGEGRSLYFSPANGIDHIFSRVTGGNASNINGTLGVLGNADLFLLNPNGIIFGTNSRLDLAGSFVGSTASGLQFDGFEFSAVVPESVPLLTVTTPTGLNLTANAGSIINQSAVDGLGLTVQPLQTLALVGGDIRLLGGRMTNRSGRIELAAVRNGRVELSPNSQGWQLEYEPVSLLRGDIQLSEQSLVRTNDALDNPASSIRLLGNEILLRGSGVLTVTRQGQGSRIELEGDRIELLEGASLQTATEGANAIGGEIQVNASQILHLQGSGNNPVSGANGNSGIFSTTAAETAGVGGAIVIKTRQLRLEDGGSLFGNVGLFSTGAGGDIRIQATESLIAENSIETEFRNTIGTETRGSGRGGNLIVNTGQLQLDESYRLSSVSWVDGNGGDIEIEADSISLSGSNPLVAILPSGITALAFGSGNSGNIQIQTQDLNIADSANVTTTVLGDRATIAGIISLFFGGDFRRIVELPDEGTGNAGDIRVMAETILVTGVNSGENSQPSNIISGSTARGNAGNVEITTQSLEVSQGALVGSSTAPAFALFSSENSAPLPGSGSGQGGDLTINADRILVQGTDSRLRFPSSLATQALGSGDGGETTINTRELTVRDGALVVAGTSNSGAGGRLRITASESIQVDGKSEAIQVNGQEIPEQPSTVGTFAARLNPLTREAFRLTPDLPEGDTGELLLKAPRLAITNGAEVSVEHQGSGNAGQLEVNVNQLRLDQAGKISATSSSGQGGNVALKIPGLVSLRRGSQITAEALGGGGNGGNLNIDAGAILAIPTENSDIIANAAGGTGGQITLRTGGLFGIEFQEQLSDSSGITASSQIGLNGTVNIDLLAVDPSQGLTELPTSPLNPNEQISTACNSRARSKFVTTGRGGLPNDPRQQLQSQRSLQDWRDPGLATIDVEQEGKARPSPLSLALQSERPIEAQVLRRDRQGKVHLMAPGNSPTAVTPSPSCSVKAPSAQSPEVSQ